MPAANFDIPAFLDQLTEQPGVYRFIRGEDILYVGKARNLKRRVSSYFLRSTTNPKTAALVAQAERVEVTIAASEDEALLLENHLIKQHKPRFNILFRDDKSYPYIHLSEHAFPQLSFRRTLRKGKGRWFGPYPNAGAVRETLQSLHRIFKLRECDDSFFAHRTRPCLQYQIQRCSAPCVGHIGAEDYARSVMDAGRLLQGRSDALVTDLNARMEQAASRLEFERAAEFKQQIAAVRRLQGQGDTAGAANVDALAAGIRSGLAGVVVLQIREGKPIGHRSYFPRCPPDSTPRELLAAFIEQLYLQHPVPAELLLEESLEDADWLAASLSRQAGRRVELVIPRRGVRQQWLRQAKLTLDQAVGAELIARSSTQDRLDALQRALSLPALPLRMECFDISHTQGESAVASCVVFRDGAALRSGYRRLNIEGITPGDDYAAIGQAVARRLAHLVAGEGERPDIIFIDGGKGQLEAAAAAVPQELIDPPLLIAIAKGEERKPGKEQLFLLGRGTPLILPPDSPALHLIQQIRDESHDWALAGHRKRRGKARTQSELDVIEGLGPARRRALLKAFGGTRQIGEASVAELKKVAGIHAALAERIHQHFRGA